MKTFTTSIFVPSVAKEEMNLIDRLELASNLNKPVNLPDNLMHGGLDDVQEGEEFILVVNGLHERHEIKMRGCNKVAGKVRFMFVEPEKPEVFRFAQWRLRSANLMSMKNGKELQLRNFSAQDLRRLIRHSVANQERKMVEYR
ncbi:hypothetical protein N1M2_101 [Klebsiella phage N1M2]|uniref:Uncharacterized protein n=1 Tax=Klebsiella phage N1M2 TaxID=2664939 RepID=A0A6B7ZFD4_9CAUD|nr:hypothetical protein PQB72_gp101 [Klebsiella phage N1M2]QGH71964.1 hypothetical protein N1M2_101 [Klebsiella phage N1M2]